MGRIPVAPSFHAENSRQALKALIGDPVNCNNNLAADTGSKWKNLRSIVCPQQIGAAAAVKAFQKNRTTWKHTSNSKYYVIRRDKWESHEDAELSVALMAQKPPSPGGLGILGKVDSQDLMYSASPVALRPRTKHPPRAVLEGRFGLRADAIQCYIKKLEGHIAARHKVMSPSSEIKPPVDPSAPRRSRAATGERDMGADAALASQMHGAGHHRNGNGGGLGDTMRPNRSKKGTKGDHSEAILSDGADSDDAGWLKEEDAINLPSDADLDAMPVGKALTALLQAQQRVILALGRVEEPWDVRLQRKQANVRLNAPQKAFTRVALFESSNSNTDYGDNQVYSKQRHIYLVSKITDLRRKQKTIAMRQEQQVASVSDRIEIEKRHMLMQLLDIEREERRIRMILRKMDDKTNSGGNKTPAAPA